MESVDTAAVAPPPLASTSAAAAAASVALPALPRWLQVKKAAEKREREYRYLKRVHRGGVHFFNTAKLSAIDLAEFYPNAKMRKRSAQWFCLGISLAPLLKIDNAVDLIKSTSLTMEEYEHEVSDFARQKMRQIFRKTDEEKTLFTVTASFQETGLYTHLLTPNVPYDLDYLQVVSVLCELLAQLYARIGSVTTKSAEGCDTAAYVDAYLKVDARIKKLIETITKELSTVANSVVVREMEPLLKTLVAALTEEPLEVGPAEP